MIAGKSILIPHVFTVNIQRELLPSIYDEIMSYNMISDDVAHDDMNDVVDVIIL